MQIWHHFSRTYHEPLTRTGKKQVSEWRFFFFAQATQHAFSLVFWGPGHTNRSQFCGKERKGDIFCGKGEDASTCNNNNILKREKKPRPIKHFSSSLGHSDRHSGDEAGARNFVGKEDIFEYSFVHLNICSSTVLQRRGGSLNRSQGEKGARVYIFFERWELLAPKKM